MLPVLALLAAAAVGRAAYPRLVERRVDKRRERGPDGVIVGAESITLPRTNAPAALLLHGAGDTPQVLSDLARHLHERGYSVRVPLLAGHGRGLAALAAVSAEEWDLQVSQEFDALRASHEWVAIVGLSMGGALAAKLAAERQDVSALVLLAPYLAMPLWLRRLAARTKSWGWLLPYFSSRGNQSIRDPDAAGRALGHGVFTPQALVALLQVVESAEAALPLVQAPTLVVQSREDNRILPESAERAYRTLGSTEKRFVWINGAGHVITVDYGYRRVYDLTAAWLDGRRKRQRQQTGRESAREADPSRRLERHPRIRTEPGRPGSRQDP